MGLQHYRLLLLRFILPFAVVAAAESRSPMNILMIVADDLGWSDTSVYGSVFCETPHIDQLAHEGMRFTQAYAASPLCMPTRASLLTGKHPARLDLTDVNPGRMFPKEKLLPPKWALELDTDEFTLAEALSEAGYRTASIGKWHLGKGASSATGQGFDVDVGGTHLGYPPKYFSPYQNANLKDGPEGEHLPARLGQEACAFLEDSDPRPFFLYLSYFSVHIPVRARPELVEKYAAKPNLGGEQVNPYYASMVESMDNSIGVVLAKLVELGLEARTLVVFMSDNGGLSTLEGAHRPATSNAPLRSGKGILYEGGIRIPLVIRWPGVTPASTQCHTPVLSVDIPFTILDVLGIDRAFGWRGDGLSLTSLLRNPGTTLDRDALYWHFPHYSRQGSRPASAIRVGDFKLLKRYDSKTLELYDLSCDLGEQVNLAETMSDRSMKLLGMLDDWMSEIGANLPVENPNYEPSDPRGGSYWGVDLAVDVER